MAPAARKWAIGTERRVRTGWAVAGATLLALALGACRQRVEHHEPGVAVVVATQQATWIRNFNPFFPTQARWPTPAGIYEPLLVYNRVTQELVPWLAVAYRWEDEGRALAMTIRDGVRWSDGTAMGPADVVFTWQLMRRHESLDQTGMWKRLTAVRASGRDVYFEFREPFTPALFFIGEAPIVPEHVWKDVADPIKFRNESPVGTGPFTEVRSFKTQVYELGKNPHYWQPGKPYLDAIRMPAFPGNEQASLALIRGDIDWAALFVPSVDRIFVRKDPAHRGYFLPEIEAAVMLYPNTTRPPLDDARVRKAVSLAIDRPRIVRIAMQGYTRPADATALTNLFARYKDPLVLAEEGDWARHDPAAAAALLDEAGFRRGPGGARRGPDGKPLHFDVECVVGWSDWIIAAQIIVRNLQDLGVSAKLRTYEQAAWLNKLQTGDFDLSVSWSTGGPEPYTFYQRQMSATTRRPIGEAAEYNWQRFASPEADRLLDEFARTPDEAEQKRIASALQRVFVRSAPAIPLFPGPAWGQYNARHVVGFPTKENPYAVLAPYKLPGNLIPLVELRPRPRGETPAGPEGAR
jgi:peptide/nickel transport system substrate-binding protein